jgi:hypothetical protein
MRLKDLPLSGQSVQMWWRKRRLICAEALCPRKTFTPVSAAVRPRARITELLRHRVARAIAAGNRAVSEVAGEYDLSWPTAHKALVVAATKWLPEPTPTSRPGIDETRFPIGSLDFGRDYLEAVRSVAEPASSTAPGIGRDRCWGWLLAAPEHVYGTGWRNNPRSSGTRSGLW